MLITALIVILLALAIGVVAWRSLSNKKTASPNQAPSPLRTRLQPKMDIEAALEFEAYKQKKETSVHLLQNEMKENQRRFAKQYHNDFEKVKSEIQSGFVHIQKENQIHIKKAHEKMQDAMKDLLHVQQKELQDFFQKANDKIKQDIQSEMQSLEQHVQRDIQVMKQFVKDEIQKATLKTTPKAPPKGMPKAMSKATPKALAAVMPKDSSTENLETQLSHIEMTENQLQTNIFNDLNRQLADVQNTMANIHADMEMLQLLHALECEFSNQAQSMTE